MPPIGMQVSPSELTKDSRSSSSGALPTMGAAVPAELADEASDEATIGATAPAAKDDLPIASLIVLSSTRLREVVLDFSAPHRRGSPQPRQRHAKRQAAPLPHQRATRGHLVLTVK